VEAAVPSRKLAALLPIAAIVPIALVPVMVSPTAAGAAPVSPAASHACSEQGNITKARVRKIHVAWIPTSWSTSFVAGPASITRTVSISSSTQWTISASFSLDEGLIFASAKEQYGISLARTTGHSASVTYTLNVPKNKTAKMQEFHRGWEMGITQWKVVCVHGFKLVKETSKTGNYLPVRSKAADTYCYAAVAHKRARIEVKHLYHNLCVPQW
jgi:hypothetical protein